MADVEAEPTRTPPPGGLRTVLLSGLPPSRLDLLLAVSVAVAGLVESIGRSGDAPGEIANPVLLGTGAIVAGALLLLRRRFPMAMLLALIALNSVVRALADGDHYYFAAWQFYSTLILVHTVGSGTEPRSRRGLAGLGSVLLAYAWLQTLPENDLAEAMIGAIFIGVAYGSGILLRRQTDRTLRLAARTTRLEVEREERARRAVAEERTRIARELHDIISHKVSLMTLQAGGVRMLLGADDGRERERELLQGVERAGREAVEELRLMLGVLRDTGSPAGTGTSAGAGAGAEAGAGTEAAGLDRLDDLVDSLRETGLRVRLRVEGERRPLPPGLSLSAFRIVQEALTNVLKHASAARADITVAYGRDRLTIEVTDDGIGPGRARAGGHGLIGMRERAAMHGGELSTGSGPGGGYRVFVRFPLDEPG